MNQLVTAMALVLLLAGNRKVPTTVVLEDTSSWQLVVSPDSSFSFRLPEKPDLTRLGPALRYDLEVGDEIRYWIMEVPTPQAALGVPPEEALTAFSPTQSGPFGRGVKLTVQESVPSTTQGLPSRLVYFAGAAPNRPEYSCRMCVIHRGRTFLVLGYAALSCSPRK